MICPLLAQSRLSEFIMLLSTSPKITPNSVKTHPTLYSRVFDCDLNDSVSFK